MLKMPSRTRALAAGILAAASISVAGAAVADNYYFRSKGLIAGAPATARAALSIPATNFRMNSPLIGILETTIGNANWAITQTPDFPSLELTASSENTLAGNAPAVTEPTTFTISAKASSGNSSATTNSASVTVYPMPSVSGGPSGNVLVGAGNVFPSFPDYVPAGILGSASYELLSGATPVDIAAACPGLSFSATTGKISGTPTAICSRTFAVRVWDSFDDASAISNQFSITAPLAFAGTPMLAYPGQVYTYALTSLTFGGRAPYSYAMTSGALPTGLTLASSGAVSGTADSAAVATTATIKVTDAGGQTASANLAFGIGVSNAHAWGRNLYGQLGDGTTTQRLTQVSVSGGKTYVQFAAGGLHTCGLVNDGTVECWGYNGYGQLGDGTNTNRATPAKVSGLSGVTAIETGVYHTCAIVTGNAVKCWGYNATGQLGDSTITDSWYPVAVSGLSGVTAISASDKYTCVIVSGGAMKCWGDNEYGQLGDGTTTQRLSPVQVAGLSGITAISANGQESCAIVSGSAKCWGYNAEGQLGDGSRTNSLRPVQVSGLTSGVTAISVGARQACAIASGVAKCWGNNQFGQLGDGTTTNRITPATVSGLSGAIAISAGVNHGCAVVSGGAAKCWGNNDFGQLGDGTTTQRLSPSAVSGLNSGATAISVGYYHTLAR
jgi:alpha-tubulin suppressor-like RCC1 family protein